MPPGEVITGNRCGMAKEDEQTGRQGGLTPGRTRALMVLVAVITGIAMWLVPVDEKQSPPSLPPLPSAPAVPGTLPMPSAADTSEEFTQPSAEDTLEALPLPPPTGGIATVTNGGDRARAFIYELRAAGAQPDASAAFAEAERMQRAGNLEDAYLLYRYAARHGEVQAALVLGTHADPAYHATATGYLPEPDPGQAYKWYSVAETAGNAEAVQRLQELRKRVQQDAEAGDEQARRLLLQWR